MFFMSVGIKWFIDFLANHFTGFRQLISLRIFRLKLILGHSIDLLFLTICTKAL
uniref:Uncharacterized protein n=1 Tax=Arundo donax TaxID=35708 RepID=A0A0A9BQA4_ARUDO